MKFIHKISKITSYIIQICLLIFVLSSNSLWGEVFALEGRTVNNAAKFEQFLKENIGEHPEGENLFRETLATAMLGYGVFLPRDGRAGQVYTAQKRPGASPTIHNPELNGHPFNASFNDHTERQLAVRLITSALHIPNFPLSQVRNIPRKYLVNLQGEFHIYTFDAPCTGDDIANNNFSCIKYYEILQRVFPNCQFHIYFTNPSIHAKAEIRHVRNLINTIKKMANKNATILKDYFKIENNKLQYNISKNLEQKQWLDLKEIDIFSTPNKQKQFIRIINRMLPRGKKFDESALKEIEELFNDVFNITNFHYHMVRQ